MSKQHNPPLPPDFYNWFLVVVDPFPDDNFYMGHDLETATMIYSTGGTGTLVQTLTNHIKFSVKYWKTALDHLPEEIFKRPDKFTDEQFVEAMLQYETLIAVPLSSIYNH